MDISGELYRLKDSFLLAAIQGGRHDECASLIELGADVNFSEGKPLELCLRTGNLPILDLLLLHGVDLNKPFGDEKGNYPIHLACSLGNTATVHHLLSAGCDPHQMNSQGQTAFDIAKEKQHEDTILCLSSYQSLQDEGISMASSKDVARNSRILEKAVTLDRVIQEEAKRSKASSSHKQVPQEEKINLRSNVPEPKQSKQTKQSKHAVSAEDKEEEEDKGSSLEKLLEEEKVKVESEKYKAQLLREQSSIIWNELVDQKSTNEELCEEIDQLQSQLEDHQDAYVRWSLEGMEEMSLQALEALESMYEEKLKAIRQVKEKRLRQELDSRNEERICVICQTEYKSVLLMPCRHLCLCKECSRRTEVRTCPLCRASIEAKIDVFS